MVANRLVAPCSKRRVPEWADAEVVMPAWFKPPALARYYRALDAVADMKEVTEGHLYSVLTTLTNLDLRLVCYNVTSTYFEGSTRPSVRFPSRAFGYSRDRRSDRPQVVLGLLCTSDGLPIAHHVFAGNTADVSTLPGVLHRSRYPVRGWWHLRGRQRQEPLISADNVNVVAWCRVRPHLATRLHHQPHLRRSPRSLHPTLGQLGAGARRPLGRLRGAPGRWPPKPWSSPASENGSDATRCAPPSSSPAPKRSCWVSTSVRDGELVDASQDRAGRPTHPRWLRG